MIRSRNFKIILSLGIVGLLIAFAIAFAFLREPEEASAPIDSISVEELADQFEDRDGALEQAEDGAVVSEIVDENASADINKEEILFQIATAESQALFTLDETLAGERKTVVGTTDQVAGEIFVDVDDPQSSSLSQIFINARTFVTDEERRDRAIKNQILDTNEYQFIVFSPTNIIGLSNDVELGTEIELEIIGELTIRDVTVDVTFYVVVTVVSETRIEGYGMTTINRNDFGLTIPSVPRVADVDEEVLLEIFFVALSDD